MASANACEAADTRWTPNLGRPTEQLLYQTQTRPRRVDPSEKKKMEAIAEENKVLAEKADSLKRANLRLTSQVKSRLEKANVKLAEMQSKLTLEQDKLKRERRLLQEEKEALSKKAAELQQKTTVQSTDTTFTAGMLVNSRLEAHNYFMSSNMLDRMEDDKRASNERFERFRLLESAKDNDHARSKDLVSELCRAAGPDNTRLSMLLDKVKGPG